MKVLVINSGSSSIKYELFDMRDCRVLSVGTLERIGERESYLEYRVRGDDGSLLEQVQKLTVKDHREGIKRIAAVLAESRAVEDASELFAIGHRVVHGGEEISQPTLIDEHVLEVIRRQVPLAPLHNPANLLGIEVTLAECPETPQVAVFDTAFHQTMPAFAYRYALPDELYTKYHIRRYGFHGTSHAHVAKAAARFLQRPLDELNLIVLHLGNGASAAAIRGGLSIDTSMGMTPLEGLVMGTRCGDIDPGVIFHLSREAGKSNDELDGLLNTQSGLKGICGVNDMREVLRRAGAGDDAARLAIEIYAYRIKKYIGAYSAALGRVDALVFTAGIGENSSEIRFRTCSEMENLGLVIDSERNAAGHEGPFAIHAKNSAVNVLVIPTDEELEIAEQTVRCIENM